MSGRMTIRSFFSFFNIPRKLNNVVGDIKNLVVNSMIS